MNSQQVFKVLGQSVSRPDDEPSVVLQKATLLLISILTTLAGVVWAIMYLNLGHPRAAFVPATYSVLISFAIVGCVATKRYRAFVSLQLILIFILPFALHYELGGLMASGVVMVWGFLAPLGSALFQSARSAAYWMVVFCAAFMSFIFLDGQFSQHAVEFSQEVTIGFFAMNLLGALGIVFVACRFFVSLYESEFQRSEDLLANILPSSVAKRLKQGESTIVDGFQSVTILFADLVGFTKACADAEPNEVLELLNEIFSIFDDLVEKYDLEKIKTIGDAYMVVGGLPVARDFHAQDVARLALEMLESIEQMNLGTSHPLELRIGIHTGPAIAGVIGVKKFAYDVWGDAVNTASRMESHGEPGKIQVSEETYSLIQDHFVFESRGSVEVKGKGMMNLFFLEREL